MTGFLHVPESMQASHIQEKQIFIFQESVTLRIIRTNGMRSRKCLVHAAILPR